MSGPHMGPHVRPFALSRGVGVGVGQQHVPLEMPFLGEKARGGCRAPVGSSSHDLVYTHVSQEPWIGGGSIRANALNHLSCVVHTVCFSWGL